jgi:hypothetical protein
MLIVHGNDLVNLVAQIQNCRAKISVSKNLLEVRQKSSVSDVLRSEGSSERMPSNPPHPKPISNFLEITESVSIVQSTTISRAKYKRRVTAFLGAAMARPGKKTTERLLAVFGKGNGSVGTTFTVINP